MAPNGACFSSGPRGYFSFDHSFEPQSVDTFLSVRSEFRTRIVYFDALGRLWRVKELKCRHRINWWARLLAHICYNPTVEVEWVWSEPERYEFADLQRSYCEAVKVDDDILTQFVEREELLRKVLAASSFGELAQVYQWAAKDHT